MRGPVVIVVAAALIGGACTLTTSLDGLSGPALDAGALPVPDAGVSADADAADNDSGGPPVKDDAGLVSAYRNVIMSDGPVAYYRLGDTGATAKDETGAHPGTVIGTISHGPGAIAGDSDGAFVGTGGGWIDISQIFPFTGNA